MKSTRDVLLDAAEELIREQGLDALSVRSLAARANYGKSTVHEAVGSADELVSRLRIRAIRDMATVCATDQPVNPEDPEWRSRLYLRLSEWILENPNWARLCFVPQGVDEHHSWAHPVASILMGALPEGTEDLDESPDGRHLAHLATGFGAAMMTTIVAIGDAEYGARVVRTTFSAIHDCIAGVIEHRANNSAPALTPIAIVDAAS